MTLYRPVEAEPDFFVLKLLRSGRPILLSDVLPLLENMGVRVYDERPYEITPADRQPIWIYDGSDYAMAIAETLPPAGRPVFAGFQVSPPSMLFSTPSAVVP